LEIKKTKAKKYNKIIEKIIKIGEKESRFESPTGRLINSKNQKVE